MSEFIPHGYLSIHEALNRLGLDLFRSTWTGEEKNARRGLTSKDRWSRIKDLPPPRGADATGGGRGRGNALARPAAARVPLQPDDPSSDVYQAEYQASERYASVCARLRVLLERGHLEAVIVDPWTGKLCRAATSLWRRHDAVRMIESGKAPIPRSRNTGSLLVKRFAEAKPEQKPIPQVEIRHAIDVLKEKLAVEKLTRPRQKDFLRQTFPNYRFTERQFNEIFKAVRVPTGRPRKSDKKL